MQHTFINGDSLEKLKEIPTDSVNCIITSPPYYQQRDYNHPNQIGLEHTVYDYMNKLIKVFNECYRILKKDGSLWIVIADTTAGDKKGKTDNKYQYMAMEQKIIKKKGNFQRKTQLGIPERLTVALIDSGWIKRRTIIWQKDNAVPSSVTDNFTADYEPVLFFVKSPKYYFKQLKEPMKTKNKNSALNGIERLTKRQRLQDPHGSMEKKQDLLGDSKLTSFNNRYKQPSDFMRNMRSVWSIPTQANKLRHFAMYPEKLVDRILEAGCPKDGVVLDPFCGAGTTLVVAEKKGINSIGIELNYDYIKIAVDRVNQVTRAEE